MKIIVTGASQGIGRGIATRLAAAGHDVGLLARSEARLQDLQQRLTSEGRSAPYVACDLQDSDAVAPAIATLIDRLGGIDALINNAGLVIRRDVFSLTLDEWHAMVNTNINGLFYATRAVLAPMRAQGQGHIINVSSISGKVPLPGGSGYAATKFACTGFSQSLFQELRDYGIKVTTIYPGSVDSASHRHDPDADHGWKVQPEEVGQACLDVLNTRPGNCVSELEIRPLSRPPQKP
jgi:NADP-dependent 3-hydroxy acid dehydrogenase YdfG